MPIAGKKPNTDQLLPGLVIVAIDDERDFLATLQDILESEGAKVYTSLTATDGLQLVEQIKPHLVLTDYTMSPYDGLYVANQIKSNIYLRHIPVVFLTGSGDSARNSAFAAGAEQYLHKPLDFNAFMQLTALEDILPQLRGLNNLK